MEVTNKFQTFQGDVDIFSIGKIPKSATLMNTKTVMEGEATGHHHTFTGQVLVYKPVEGDTLTIRGGTETVQVQKYIELKQDQLITHQEHAPQTIPKGTYAIPQEREWNILANQLRRVID